MRGGYGKDEEGKFTLYYLHEGTKDEKKANRINEATGI